MRQQTVVQAAIGVVLFWVIFLVVAIGLSTRAASNIRLVPNIPYVEGTPKAVHLENNSSHRLRMGMNNHGMLDAICDDCTNAGDIQCERTMEMIICKDS